MTETKRETKSKWEERMAKKIRDAKWPDDVSAPAEKPPLDLSTGDGNVFSIVGRARRAARRTGWTNAQVDAFTTLANAGDYDHALQTCFRYFDVR